MKLPKTTNKQHTTSNMTKFFNDRILGGALLAVAALVLTGCSSVPTSENTGPIQAKTFSFINTGTSPAANNAAPIHPMIQKAITHTLAGKGLSQMPAGGDVTVAYLIIAGNNTTTTSLNEYFGYGDEATALVEKIHQEQTVDSDRRGHFEEGTLVIDLLNPKTEKLLWRNSVQRDILRNLTPEARAARLQEIVDASLKDLQIAR
jgi:PBP1b-binding outer membrane lipoprotein LpoB